MDNRVMSTVLQWSYPGCQRLFMRGFRFRSSLLKVTRFAARVFGLWPTKRSSPSHARKNLWYPGYSEADHSSYSAPLWRNTDTSLMRTVGSVPLVSTPTSYCTHAWSSTINCLTSKFTKISSDTRPNYCRRRFVCMVTLRISSASAKIIDQPLVSPYQQTYQTQVEN